MKVIFKITGKKEKRLGGYRWPIYFQITTYYSKWKFWKWEFYIMKLFQKKGE